jgi:hypothetical protein
METRPAEIINPKNLPTGSWEQEPHSSNNPFQLGQTPTKRFTHAQEDMLPRNSPACLNKNQSQSTRLTGAKSQFASTSDPSDLARRDSNISNNSMATPNDSAPKIPSLTEIPEINKSKGSKSKLRSLPSGITGITGSTPNNGESEINSSNEESSITQQGTASDTEEIPRPLIYDEECDINIYHHSNPKYFQQMPNSYLDFTGIDEGNATCKYIRPSAQKIFLDEYKTPNSQYIPLGYQMTFDPVYNGRNKEKLPREFRLNFGLKNSFLWCKKCSAIMTVAL